VPGARCAGPLRSWEGSRRNKGFREFRDRLPARSPLSRSATTWGRTKRVTQIPASRSLASPNSFTHRPRRFHAVFPPAVTGTAADTTAAPACPPPGRDSRGRFTHGNPGRPPRHRNAAPSPSAANGENTVAATETAAGQTATPGGASPQAIRAAPATPSSGGWRRCAASCSAPPATPTTSAASPGDCCSRPRGDLPAVNAPFRVLLGRPAKMVDPDTLAVQEWRTRAQTLVPPDEVTGLLRRLPPALALDLLRAVLPCPGASACS
jgi:hypothetical protein